jgi:hypothetical protein
MGTAIPIAAPLLILAVATPAAAPFVARPVSGGRRRRARPESARRQAAHVGVCKGGRVVVAAPQARRGAPPAEERPTLVLEAVVLRRPLPMASSVGSTPDVARYFVTVTV